MSLCVKEIITPAINVLALPPSLPSLLVLGGEWSPVARGERASAEAGFDAVPGGLPEPQHQSKKQFLPCLHLFPFSSSSISRVGLLAQMPGFQNRMSNI